MTTKVKYRDVPKRSTKNEHTVIGNRMRRPNPSMSQLISAFETLTKAGAAPGLFTHCTLCSVCVSSPLVLWGPKWLDANLTAMQTH